MLALVMNTPRDYLSHYSPKNCIREFKTVTTIEKAIEMDSISLSKMSKDIGDEKTEGYVKLWVFYLNQLLNLKRPLNEVQIDEIAFTVVNEYRNLTIADINLIFTNAKKGQYGEFYESITIPKVLKWFNDYSEERQATCAERSIRKHIEHLEGEKKSLGLF